MPARLQIPVALSARHVHLTRDHVEALFGKGHALCALRPLSQPGQFACQETVDLVGPKGQIPGVRVLGPERPDSQAELSLTDGFVLGLPLPVRVSGDVKGTPGGHLVGPRGAVPLAQGFIVAARHVHLHPDDARTAGVADQQVVAVRLLGRRALIFDQVVVRVSPQFQTELHLDTDEGNAAGVEAGDQAEVLADVCELCPSAACVIRDDRTRAPARPFCDFAQSNLRIR
jgi:putative phosphotransacetylase